MNIEKRKRQVVQCEGKLNDAMRRLSIANTVVKRWRQRLRTQERALLKELEAQVDVVRAGRKFLSEE